MKSSANCWHLTPMKQISAGHPDTAVLCPLKQVIAGMHVQSSVQNGLGSETISKSQSCQLL